MRLWVNHPKGGVSADRATAVGGEPGANYLVLTEPGTIKLSLSVDLSTLPRTVMSSCANVNP
jgi:hypothetical protein